MTILWENQKRKSRSIHCATPGSLSGLVALVRRPEGCSSPDPAIKELIRLGRSSRAGSEGIMVGHTLMADETGSPR
jgi:hypothetical protein